MIDRGAQLVGGSLVLTNDAEIIFQGPESHQFSGGVQASGTGTVHLRTDTTVSGTLTNNLQGNTGLLLESTLSGGGTLVNNGVVTWQADSLELTGGVFNHFTIVLAGGVKNLSTFVLNELDTQYRSGTLNMESGGN